MKAKTFIDEDQLISQATRLLFDGLGPVEAGRFLSLPRKRRVESVQRHREWQSTLDKDIFFRKVFKPQDSSETAKG